MSRSSVDGPAPAPPRPPAASDRGQIEPLAALAAVFAMTVGVGLYTGALAAAVPGAGAADLAPTALDAVAGAASDPTGVLVPARLPGALAAGPDDHRMNATLTAAGHTWRIGPPVPTPAPDRAARRIAVALAANRTSVGRLRVVVW